MINAGGVNIPVGADSDQLRKDMEAMKRLFGSAMDSMGGDVEKVIAAIRAMEQAEKSRAGVFERTANESRRLFDLMKVGARETAEALEKVKLDPNAVKVPSAAFESLTKWRDQAAYAIGAGTTEAVEKAKSMWEGFKDTIERTLLVGAVGLASAVAAAALTVIYAAYKSISFGVGLITGESYKSENIDALVAMNKEVKELQERLPLTALGASALNEALKANGLTGSAYASAINTVNSSLRTNTEELDRLGIKYKSTDGSLMSQEKVLQNVAVALGEYREGWDRTQAEQAIGMGSLKEINAALEVTPEKIETAKQRLLDYNLVIGEDTQTAIKRYEKAMRAFDRETEMTSLGFKKAIAVNVMPILTDLAEFFEKGFPTAVTTFQYTFATITAVFYGFKTGLYAVLESILGTIEAMGKGIGGVGSALALAMTGNFSGAKDALVSGWVAAKARLGEIWEGIKIQALRNSDAVRLAFSADNIGVRGASGARGRGGSKAYTPKPEEEEEEVAKLNSAYEALMKTIAEHSAIQAAELEGQVQLTEAQKIAQKAMVALRDGRLVLNDVEKEGLVIALEKLLAYDKELVKRKQLEEAMKRDIAASEEAQREYKRRQQVVADFNSTQQQAISDLKFETELLAIEAKLNGTGLLLKEDEIRLTSQVNLERETAIGMRKIEEDLRRGLLALGRDEEAADYAEIARLYAIADARKASLPDQLAARENAKMVNALNRNAVDVFSSMWSTAENTGRQAFAYLLGQGTSTFKSIGQALKTSVIDVLYQLTVRKWIVQLGTSVAGSLGISTAANATSNAVGSAGGSMLGSMFSGLPGLGVSLSNVGTAVSTFSTMLAEGAGVASAFSAATAGMGASLLSLAGPVGLAIAAASAFGLFDGGGPKNSELAIRGLGGGRLGLEPINVNGAGNIDANNPAYAQAAELLNQIPAAIREGLIGKSVGTGPSDSAEGMIKALFALPELQAAFKAAEEDAKKLAVATEALAQAEALAAAAADERKSLEIRMLEAQGHQAAAREIQRAQELAGTMESNRAFLQSIYAAEDMARASKEAAEAEAARAASIREAERIAREAAEAEAARAAKLSHERRGLEIRLLEAAGDAAGVLAARRADEMAATNDLNRELLRQIYATDDLRRANAEAAAATEAATKAAEEAAAAQRSIEKEREDAVLRSMDVLRQAYQRESGELSTMIQKWQAAGASLRAYGAQLAGGGGGGASYAVTSQAFNQTAARARLGDLTAIADLQAAGEAFRASSLISSATQVAYMRDVGRIQAAVAETIDLTDRQGTVAQEQLDQMRQQVSELVDVNKNLTSVHEAIEDVRAGLAQVQTSTATLESFQRRLSEDGTSLRVKVV